jgi:hypothetical protein
VDNTGRLYTLSAPRPQGYLLRCYPDRFTPPVWECSRSEAGSLATARTSGAETQLYSATQRYQLQRGGPTPQITWEAHLLHPFLHPDDPRRFFSTLSAQLSPDGTQLITAPLTTSERTWASLNKLQNSTSQPQLIISTSSLKKDRWKFPHQPENQSWVWTDQNDDGQPATYEYTEWPVPTASRVFIDTQSGLWALDATGTLWHSTRDTLSTPTSLNLPKLENADLIYEPTSDHLLLWNAERAQLFASVTTALKNKTTLTALHEWNFSTTTPPLRASGVQWDGKTLWARDEKKGAIYGFTPGQTTGQIATEPQPESKKAPEAYGPFRLINDSPWGSFFLSSDPHSGLGQWIKKNP